MEIDSRISERAEAVSRAPKIKKIRANTRRAYRLEVVFSRTIVLDLAIRFYEWGRVLPAGQRSHFPIQSERGRTDQSLGACAAEEIVARKWGIEDRFSRS